MMPRNSSPIIEKEIICTYKIKLEKVLGVTVSSNAALASDNNSTIAYPAGCTVVLFNTKTERQSHIVNSSRKTISSLAFSSCGRYIVTGECGHQPAVRIWDLLSDQQQSSTSHYHHHQQQQQQHHPGLAQQPQQICELFGHKYGVNCVAFSPSSKYVVSIGTQHDMIVNVWDWKNNVKVASNKVSMKVKAIAFADNGSYFVTVGNRHVKFWYLEYGKSKYKEAVPLMGRSAILGEQRNNYFCDVACGRGKCGDSTYAITRSGLLCEFNNRRLLDKWVALRTTSANCITVGDNYIFVGCAEAIIRCFDPATLHFITTLPRTHYLGVDVSLGNSIKHIASTPSDAKYPDTLAITYNETNHKLTCIYNDHSIYIWDVFNIQRVGKSFSFLYHSACIWGVEMPPENNHKNPLPSGTFLTCSSDDTIRVWTLDQLNNNQSNGMYRQNVYSNELLKVVYVDKDLSYIKDLDLSASSNNANSGGDSKSQQQQQQETSYDGRNGVRCIRISPDGKHLASGDRSGNIRIHDTQTMSEIFKIEAHDAEVLCLEYSGVESNLNLMASASRDRLLHIFDVKQGYEFLQTLDDHSSSITAVRFLNHNGNHIQMISCGADKSLMFRSLGELGGKPQFTRNHNATGKTTLYDMEIDMGQKHVLTACQDRNVRVYNVNTGKHTKSFKGSTGDDGTLIKVVLDRSGIYLATSCTDKSLSVYDYYSGECMATMCGHSELATGLRFTNDCRRLISASGDGCIFVWRVPHDMVVTMHARLSQQAMRQGKTLTSDILNDSGSNNSNMDIYDNNTNVAANVDANYRFSIGQLPQWAKKQLTVDTPGGTPPPPALTTTKANVAAPKGRWAQRAETTMNNMKNFYTNTSLVMDSSKSFDSDGGSSFDGVSNNTKRTNSIIKNSIDNNITLIRGDGTNNGLITATTSSDTGFESSTAHDGDIDSDNEYRQRPLYYPNTMQTDSQSGSEFTVTNIDVDELRKSQRKKKVANLPKIVMPPLLQQQQQPLSSTYCSQDSDDDDDDDNASTPSGENTDRNPLSLFSISTESLDQLVNREKYLQSTFESMSGAEMELTPNNSNNSNKSSISSKFLTRTTDVVNMAAINAVKQTRTDPETQKKRQLLSKRIAETKKKLESVGHISPLKYSQSIHDLSHMPAERDKWTSSTNTSSSKIKRQQQQQQQVYLNEKNSGGSTTNLRRSCSLSDLSVQKPIIVAKHNNNINRREQATTAITTSSDNRKTLSSRGPAHYTKNSNKYLMQRSRSTYQLNHQQLQSDSDNDSPTTVQEKKMSRLMRPTISSHNKINNNNNNKQSLLQSRNKKQQSYSTSNLTTIGSIVGGGDRNLSSTTSDDDDDDDNDDDVQVLPIVNNKIITTPAIVSVKPIVPPRNNRGVGGTTGAGGHVGNNYDNNTGQQQQPIVAPRRHYNNQISHTSNSNKVFDKTVSTTTTMVNSDDDLMMMSGNNNDLLTTSEVTNELCKNVIQQLTQAADNVVKIYNRLNDYDDKSCKNNNDELSSTQQQTTTTTAVTVDQIDDDDNDNAMMIKNLEMSIIHTHKVLHDCIVKKLKQSNDHIDVNQTDTVKKLNDLVTKGPTSPNSVINMMEQYSDILLDMVQQKIHNSNNII